MAAVDPHPLHATTSDQAFATLEASGEGLSNADARDRLEHYGPNELTFSEDAPWWKVLLHQFTSPLIAILIVATIITAALRHWADSIAIAMILLLNATVGYWQERKAAKEVRALASLTVPQCRVRRNGEVRTISSTDVVPGDLVLLESGDRVPADLRVVHSAALTIDESMLTGENMPVTKTSEPAPVDAVLADQTSMAFSGTLVTSGRGRGLVVATGEDTELGRINELIQGPKGKTPLELLLHSLERRIGVVVGLVATFVFTASMVVGSGFDQSFLYAVALAVAAIPEALPVVLTIAMALGVRHMAQVNAVVRTLPAVETLGSTSIIGSDKTGTLTRNLLTVNRVWSAAGLLVLDGDDAVTEVDDCAIQVLRAGGLANEAHPDEEARAGFTGDAVDVAMAAAAVRWASLEPDDVKADHVAHTPYESDLRYSQTLRHRPGGGYTLYVKGAPDALVSMSTSMLTSDGEGELDSDAIESANEEMAAQGLRVLATARRHYPASDHVPSELDHPSELEFLGLQGMQDPPRPGVKQAISECRDAGIEVMMITGDHPMTAAAIAAEIGINSSSPLTGAEIAQLDDDALIARLHQTGVAARVTPQDKLRIIELLRRDGATVAVTGDGVNDAPALKAASIGVAMGRSGTEVAREASDIVLTDDNFVTIVRAVEQGRITFAAIQKATFFLLSTALAVLLAVAVNSISDLPLIFLPIQVLWINVVTNGLQDVALAFEPAEGGELKRKPRKPTDGLLTRTLWTRTAVSGVWIGLITLFSFRWALDSGFDEDHARTFALTMLVALNFFQVMNSRTVYRSLLVTNPLSNWLLLIAATGSIGLHVIAMTWSPLAGVLGLVPLSATEWMWCFAGGATVMVLVEIDKALRRRFTTTGAAAAGSH